MVLILIIIDVCIIIINFISSVVTHSLYQTLLKSCLKKVIILVAKQYCCIIKLDIINPYYIVHYEFYLLDDASANDRSKHEGRVRHFPHVRGQWPTFIYVTG